MKTLLRGGPPPVQLWRRDEDNLFHHRSASRRSDSQTPGESGVPRPGPVRAARDRGPEAIPCHEFQRRPLEHWANLDPKLRTLHVCPSGAPNVARIRWEERIFQKRFLEPAFRPAKPGFIAQQGSHLRWPRDRMSYSSLRFGLG